MRPATSDSAIPPAPVRTDGAAYSPSGYPGPVRTLFFLFALYLVIPIVDFPLLGLSVSAPIFFVVAVACLLKPPRPWLHAYRGWILLAALIWLGIFIAAVANGLISGGVTINREGAATVIRYAYWLLVFVVTAHFASQSDVIIRLANVLGWGIFVLALLRLGEALFYDKIGAWVGTLLLAQNDYGFLFSAFSPFLLVFMLQKKGAPLLLAVGANVLLWAAVAINGSRGSWVAMGIGLVLILLILARTQRRRLIGLLMGLLFAGGASFVILAGVPRVSLAVLERLDTFQNLDTDKSYQIRQLMNQKAIALFKESPLIGVGASRFRLSITPLEIPLALSYASQAHFNRKSAHNAYLGFLAENGLIAAVPFALLVLLLLVRGVQAQSQFVRRREYWALAVFVGFLQMSVHMWVISSLTNTMNWFVYGLVAAMIVNERRPEAE